MCPWWSVVGTVMDDTLVENVLDVLDAVLDRRKESLNVLDIVLDGHFGCKDGHFGEKYL